MTSPASNLQNSDRARVRQHPERSAPDEADAILASGLVAHVSWNAGDQPFVIPFGYHFDQAIPDRLYLHGGHGSSTLKHLSRGDPVCVAVTLVDGLVFSRTALNHSMNYRSVVCFGRGRSITDAAEKRRIFEAMTRRYYPGREQGIDYQSATDAQITATAVIEIAIEEKSAKIRRGGPTGPTDAAIGPEESCGVVWLTETRETEYWPKA